MSKEESVCDYLCINVCPSNVWENTCYYVQNCVKWASSLSEIRVFNFQSVLKTWLVANKNLKKQLKAKQKKTTNENEKWHGCSH